MDSRKIVLKNTTVLMLGELLGSAVMLIIFAAFRSFSWVAALSALTGSIVITAYYFAMAVTVSLAADRAAAGEAKKAQQMVQLSSTVRLVCMGVVLLAAIKLGANVVALLLPLLFMRPILMVAEFFGKKVD